MMEFMNRAPLALILLMVTLLVAGCGSSRKGPPALTYKVSYDLTVEGKRMTISRKVRCHPNARGMPYSRSISAFGEFLPSGAGVFAIVPVDCGRWSYLIKGNNWPEYLPTVGYLEDANVIDGVKVFYSKDHLLRPNPLVQYHTTQVELLGAFAASDKKGRFDFFGGGGRTNNKREDEQDRQYELAYEAKTFWKSLGRASLYMEYPKDVWEKFPKISVLIDEIQGGGTRSS